MPKLEIAILDNDVWSASSLAQWITMQGGPWHVLWHLSSTSRALHECLFGKVQPDVLLLDMALGQTSGVSFCRELRKRSEHVAILGMTAYECDDYQRDLADAGAQGIVDKAHMSHILPNLLPLLARGESIQPDAFKSVSDAYEDIQSDAARFMTQGTPLSDRERQILKQYARGETAKEIADGLGLSRNSVYTYLRRAMYKFGAESYTDAIRIGKQYDVI